MFSNLVIEYLFLLLKEKFIKHLTAFLKDNLKFPTIFIVIDLLDFTMLLYILIHTLINFINFQVTFLIYLNLIIRTVMVKFIIVIIIRVPFEIFFIIHLFN